MRFPGKIPVMLKQGTGLTRDYSVDGVYFVTDQPLSPGEEIELTLLLNYQTAGQGMRLGCRGKVQRVEHCSEKLGVAVAVHCYLFEGNREWLS